MPESSESLKIRLEVETKSAEQELKEFEKRAQKDRKIKLEIDIAKLQSELESARRRLRKFKKDGNKDAELKARLDISNLQKNIRTARSEIRKLEKQSGGFFSSFGSIFKDFAKGFLIFSGFNAVSNFIRDATQSAIEFDIAFRGVRKTVDASESEFKALNSEIKNLSKELGIAAPELARIAELAGQLGVAKQNIKEFTETIAKIAVSTNLTSEEAATSFARIINVTGLSQDKIENLASSVVFLGNNFATTEREITNFSERIAGAGAIVGLTDADITGIATAFTSVGIQAESGGTAVQKALLKMNEAVNNGGVELEKFALLTNKSSKQFAKDWRDNAGSAFSDFVKGLGNAGDDAGKILGDLIGEDVRLQRAFLSLAQAGDLVSDAIDGSNEAFKENTALSIENEKRQATLSGQLEIQKQRWEANKRAVGEFMLEFLVPLLDKFNDLTDILGKHTIPTLSLFAAGIVALASPITAIGIALVGFTNAVINATNAIIGFIDASNQLSDAQGRSIEILNNQINKSTQNIKKLREENKKLAKEQTKEAVETILRNQKIIDLEKQKQRVISLQMERASILNKKIQKETEFFQSKNDKALIKSYDLHINVLDKKIEAEGEAQRKIRKEFSETEAQYAESIGSIGKRTEEFMEGQDDLVDSAIKNNDKIKENLEDLLEKIGDGASDASSETSESFDKLKNEAQKALAFIEKEREKNSRRIKKANDFWEKSLKDVGDEMEKLAERHKRTTDGIRDDIVSIEDELTNLQKEYNKTNESEKKAFGEKVASRVSELKEELLEVEEAIRTANEEGRGIDIPELEKRKTEIKEEIKQGTELVSPEQIAEADRVAGLTDIQKMQEDFAKSEALRQKEFENEKAILEERKAINEAFLIEDNDLRLKKIEELAENASDLENKRFAEKLLRDETARVQEIKALEDQHEKIVEKQEYFNKRIEAIEEKTTQELIKKWEAVQRAKERALGATATALSESGSTTTNNQTINITNNNANDVDVESSINKIFQKL